MSCCQHGPKSRQRKPSPALIFTVSSNVAVPSPLLCSVHTGSHLLPHGLVLLLSALPTACLFRPAQLLLALDLHRDALADGSSIAPGRDLLRTPTVSTRPLACCFPCCLLRCFVGRCVALPVRSVAGLLGCTWLCVSAPVLPCCVVRWFTCRLRYRFVASGTDLPTDSGDALLLQALACLLAPVSACCLVQCFAYWLVCCFLCLLFVG